MNLRVGKKYLSKAQCIRHIFGHLIKYVFNGNRHKSIFHIVFLVVLRIGDEFLVLADSVGRCSSFFVYDN